MADLDEVDPENLEVGQMYKFTCFPYPHNYYFMGTFIEYSENPLKAKFKVLPKENLQNFIVDNITSIIKSSPQIPPAPGPQGGYKRRNKKTKRRKSMRKKTKRRKTTRK